MVCQLNHLNLLELERLILANQDVQQSIQNWRGSALLQKKKKQIIK